MAGEVVRESLTVAGLAERARVARDKRALGRDLTAGEARTFTAIARRLTALVLLGPELDANYLKAADPA